MTARFADDVPGKDDEDKGIGTLVSGHVELMDESGGVQQFGTSEISAAHDRWSLGDTEYTIVVAISLVFARPICKSILMIKEEGNA